MSALIPLAVTISDETLKPYFIFTLLKFIRAFVLFIFLSDVNSKYN